MNKRRIKQLSIILVVLALVIASGIVIGGFDWVASNLIKLLISLFNA